MSKMAMFKHEDITEALNHVRSERPKTRHIAGCIQIYCDLCGGRCSSSLNGICRDCQFGRTMLLTPIEVHKILHKLEEYAEGKNT